MRVVSERFDLPTYSSLNANRIGFDRLNYSKVVLNVVTVQALGLRIIGIKLKSECVIEVQLSCLIVM